jgi:predicted HTH transcriptional regulator
LLTDSDVADIEVQGRKILVFRIPQAQRTQRPIYCGRDPYSGTYKRNYEGDYKCTKDEVQRMFADADVNRPADCRILKNFTFNDIDKQSLEQFRRLFAVSKPDHPWLALSDLELLTMLGGYRIDRATKEEGFTLAGLLMFGKNQSITDPECAPHFFPDYRLYSSDNPVGNERWIDRVYPDGTWEANLFQFYRRVLPKLTSVLPIPFRLDEDTRIDETSTHIALREALINLCIHADYTVNASLIINQYPHHIVLSNPGTLLISRWQYYRGGESVCRNLSLQKMFTMFGKAEKAGSGVGKILQGWKDQNWKRPFLRISNKPDKVELDLRLESILPDEHKQKLIKIFGKDCLHWDSDKLTVMALACAENDISNESLQFILPNHRTDITELLRRLKTDGLLESEGYGRGTHYHIPEHLLLESAIAVEDAPINSKTSDESARPKCKTSNESARPKRKTHEQTIDMILNYVSDDYHTSEEIARHIGMSHTYVLRNFITPMVKDGKLQKLHPQKANHPYQQYTNKKD